jgi:hypothetical protein
MFKVHNEPHYLRVEVTGDIDQQSLYDAQSALMRHPEYPHKNSLWVFDDDFVCGFSNRGLFEMIDRIKAFFPVGGTKEKGAILASSGLHYAFFKLFCDEADRKGIPFKMKPFRTHHEAEEWLMDTES